jgi:hypothetical protein
MVSQLADAHIAMIAKDKSGADSPGVIEHKQRQIETEFVPEITHSINQLIDGSNLQPS